MKFVAPLVIIVSSACSLGWSGAAHAAPPDAAPGDSSSQQIDFRTLDDIVRRLDQDLSADISYLDGGDNVDVLRNFVLQLEERAAAGDRVAQFELAAVHLGNLHGHGDAGRAWHWLLEAAGPDHPLTQLAAGRHRLRETYQFLGPGHYERDTLHRAICRMGPAAVAAIPTLERELRREAYYSRFDLARGLVQLGERGNEVLFGLLDSPDRDLRHAAIEGLSQGFPVADEKSLARFTPRITALLRNDDPVVRKGAENALARIKDMEPFRKHRAAGLPGRPPERHGAKTPETAAKVRRLIDDLKSPDTKTREKAAEALKSLHGEACTAVPALLPLFKDPDKDVREAAVDAVWFIGPGGVEVDTATPLIAALDDKEFSVRAGAAHALAAPRPGGERAIPTLLRYVAALDDSSNYSASDALTAMAQREHGPPIIVGLLEAMQRAKEPPLKVIETLGKIGKHAAASVPALEPLLRHDDFKVRLEAARAVALIGTGPVDRAIALIRAEMRTDDSERRRDAIRMLFYIGPPAAPALPDLIALLDDPGPAAVASFRRAAEQGCADAQLELGLALRDGLDGVADPRGAETWIRRAAEQGHAEAQRRLAIMYRQGSGVRRDEAAAESWYRKAIVPRIAQRITGPRVSEKQFQATLEPHTDRFWKVEPSEDQARMSLATIGRLLPGKRKVRHLQVLSDGNLYSWDVGVDSLMPEFDGPTAGNQLDLTLRDELLKLLEDLPAGVGYVPVEQRLVFSRSERGLWKTQTYDLAALPAKIRLILFHARMLDDSIEPDPRLAPVVVRSEVPLLRDIAFRPDGTLLVFGDMSRVYGRRDGRTLAPTDPALESLTSLPGTPLGMSPDGTRVVVHDRSLERHRLLLYEPRKRSVVAELGTSEMYYVIGIKAGFSADGTVFALPSHRKTENEFRNASTGEVRAKFTVVESADTVLSPDGKLAAVRVGESTVQLVDTATGIVQQTFPGSVAAFTRDGRQLAVRSHELLTLYEPAIGDSRTVPLMLHRNLVGPMAYSPDGRLLACTFDHDRIAVIDAATTRVVGLPGPHHRRDPRKLGEDVPSSIIAIEFTPDGKQLATATMDGVIKLWNTQAIRRDD